MEFLSKLIFLLKRPNLVIVAGDDREGIVETIFKVLKPYFKTKKVQKFSFQNILRNKVLILETELGKVDKLKFFIRKSKLPILAIAQTKESFLDNIARFQNLAKKLPSCTYLILNFDNKINKNLENEAQLRYLSFGIQDGADLKATDIHINDKGINFKICYKGSIVPIWVPYSKFEKQESELDNKKQIYNALIAVSAGIILGLNLVEISQALKN